MRIIDFVAAGVLVSGALFVATAYAGDCLTEHPNYNIKFGAAAEPVNQVSGNVWDQSSCGSFIVDIAISSAASQLPPPPPAPASWQEPIVISAGDEGVAQFGGAGTGIQTAFKKEECQSYKESVALYKKSGSDYKLVSEYKRKGVWNPGVVDGYGKRLPDYCTVNMTSGSGSFAAVSAPKSGTDEYRIVESSFANGKPRKVHVGVSHTMYSGIH